MKILIHADCEGLCGIRAFVDASGKVVADLAADAKMQQLNEINACIDGLRRAGADEILVWDNCCTSGTPVFNIYDLRPGVYFADSRDPAGPVMHLDAGFDGAILLGATAMNHTPDAFMAHSVNSRIFDSLELNGLPIGDIELNILTASYFQVPVLLVSGDDKACREAQRFCGGEMESVETKKGAFLLEKHESFSGGCLPGIDSKGGRGAPEAGFPEDQVDERTLPIESPDNGTSFSGSLDSHGI